MQIDQFNRIIASRRAIYPKEYLEGVEVPRSKIEQILENANWAPSHKQLEPWRFYVLHSKEIRQKFGDFAVEAHQHMGNPLPEPKAKRVAEAPLQAGCVVVLCMHHAPDAQVPEWENLAAVAAAVQNMWLTCTALGLGAYWSTPKNVLGLMHTFVPMHEHEKCVGLFYIGHHEKEDLTAKRKPIQEKTSWF